MIFSSSLKNSLLSALILMAVYVPVAAQTNPVFDRQKMDTYLSKLDKEQKFMGSVAIDSAGKEVYNRSIGFITNTNGAPVKADGQTAYRVGSVTKTFTATMIMQLIEEDKLSLSTKLAKFYPELPQADNITIEHLLRHQSGLYNFTNAPNYPTWMTRERSKKQLLELFRGQEPQFNPGQKTSYSNTNYVLLGFILEDITGEPYATQLKKRISEPLNLGSTYYGSSIDPGKNEAASFQYNQSQWQKMPETNMSIPGGAGALVSTPDDLSDFIRALFEGKLVSEKSLEQMTTMKDRLGMGLMIIPFYDSYAYGHNGGIDGFQSNVSYLPKENVAMAFTANGLNYPMNNILIGVLSIYFGKNFEIPSFEKKPTLALSAKEMQKYTGKYESDQLPMEIEVFVDNGALKAQAAGQAAFPLTATDKRTMRFEQAGIIIKFDSLKNGQYQQFNLQQGGGSFLFTRKK